MSGCVVLANCLLEIACLTKMMEALTGRKNRKGNVLQYVIIVMNLGVSTYINFCDGNRLLQVLYYVGLLLLFKLRYGMSIVDTVSYTIFGFLIVGALEFLVYVPFNLLYYTLHLEGDFSVYIVLVVLFICTLLEKRGIIVVNGKWIDFYKRNINVQFIIILFTLILAFSIGLIKFEKGMSWNEGVYLSVALFMFLVFVYKLGVYQMEIDYHKRYSDKYGEVITELRERQHKFMNQLDSVYALCQIYDSYDELVQHQGEELESIRKYLMPGKLLILERPLVIAHIYTKLCEAEEKQIHIHADLSCSLENIDVPDIFLIEIIGNLLDNAIDEVAVRGRYEKIRIAIMDDGNEICISVGNEHEKILYKEYRMFFEEGYSRKGNRRGVGLPYVKKIVDKFHGRIEVGNIMYEADNYFVVSIYFKR